MQSRTTFTSHPHEVNAKKQKEKQKTNFSLLVGVLLVFGAIDGPPEELVQQQRVLEKGWKRAICLKLPLFAALGLYWNFTEKK
jgi:hypothetical protein